MTDLEEVPNDDTPSPAGNNYRAEDARYPLRDWQEAVAEDYTRMGYWQWVEVQQALRDDDP